MGDIFEIGKTDRLTARLAQCFRDLRHRAGWSLDELTDRCGVSRATLSRLEHAEVSPTAQALSRIAAAYDMPVSRLILLAESDTTRVFPRTEQIVTHEPTTGAEWRAVSPSDGGFAASVSEGVLPQDAIRDLPGAPGKEIHIVLQDGRLEVTLDSGVHELRKGDSLRFHCEGPSVLRGMGKRGARFLMVGT